MPHRQYDPVAVRHALEVDATFYRLVWGDDIRHIREICRQQILGDRELLQDIDAGRETDVDRQEAIDRLFFVERAATHAGLELPPLLDEGRDVLAQLTENV